MAGLVDATLERFISAEGQAARPDAVALLRGLLLRAEPRGFAFTCEAIRDADWRAELARVRCPTLVISGERDPGTTPAMGQQIADAIAGARHQVIAAAAHLSVLEQPRAFADAVLQLLSELR
jgi:3-oxoadipate enol-lactonase